MSAQLEFFYEKMLLIRTFEETLLRLFSQGYLRGTVHTCIGQEACAVGIIAALNSEQDTVCSNHRGHGHFLMFSEQNMYGLFAEILGLESGICNGKGGSQHLHVTNFYSNGILGGMVPVATGIALAHKLKKENAISVVFVGDGAMAEGIIYESLNMAALWQLPLLLVVEQNQIAQSTPWTLEHGSIIEDRSPAFGVPRIAVDGNHVESVYNTAKELITQMRIDNAPRCLVLHTYRLGPHSKGDDQRSSTELAMNQEKDPLKQLEILLTQQIVTHIKMRCQKRISDMLTHFLIS